MVTMLFIALGFVGDAVSSLSPSDQEINSTSTNEPSARATLISRNETGNVNDTSNEARKLYDEGHALLKLKKFNEAIASFDKALAINANNTVVLKDKQKALDSLSKMK